MGLYVSKKLNTVFVIFHHHITVVYVHEASWVKMWGL
jgi:hypothetical protein